MISWCNATCATWPGSQTLEPRQLCSLVPGFQTIQNWNYSNMVSKHDPTISNYIQLYTQNTWVVTWSHQKLFFPSESHQKNKRRTYQDFCRTFEEGKGLLSVGKQTLQRAICRNLRVTAWEFIRSLEHIFSFEMSKPSGNQAAKTMQNYFTAIEQAAICMETRMVRTAAREREYAQDNKLLCFLASGVLVPTTWCAVIW